MHKYKILIVEDEEFLAYMIRISFPTDQFIAKACTSGKDALEELGKDRPDLIVLDIMMPKMDGWEVLQKLKSDSRTSSIPVVMCTARDNLIDVEKSFRYGAQSYIVKPIDFKKLLKKIAVILDIEKLMGE